MDPRLWIAQTYRALRGKDELTKQFENEYMNCDGPDHAIEICQKYLAMA